MTTTPTLIRAFVALALAGALALWVAPAGAQEPESPPIAVEPAVVDGPGEVEFTISGTGWDYPKVGIIPCGYPESGNIEDIGSSTCQVPLITEHIPDNGSFEVTITYDVPAEGMSIVVTSADDPQVPTAVSALLVPVGQPSNPEPPAADTEASASDQEPTTLANTGRNTDLLLAIGLSLTAIGLLATIAHRRTLHTT